MRQETESPQSVVILGADVRAAAYSAARAGLSPWCADLFGDRDLRRLCPATAIPREQYPEGFDEILRSAPPGPWMYTGGLENYLRLIERWSRDRPLWGNPHAVVKQVRDPFDWTQRLRTSGIPCPQVKRAGETLDSQFQWLVKPLRGAGGSGIAFAESSRPVPPHREFFQEFIKGESQSALFVADGTNCRLLGVSRQLVGESWLHAARFSYCGSVGPLGLSETACRAWERIGTELTRWAGIRGLLGVDAIVRDGLPWPVEINPRYSASLETWELATGQSALALHQEVFATGQLSAQCPMSIREIVGKAVLYAPTRIEMPEGGPWDESLTEPIKLWAVPRFADISGAGTVFEPGQPVMTVFAARTSVAACEAGLRAAAAGLFTRFA